MKIKAALVSAMIVAFFSVLNPALTLAQRQTTSVRQHGSSFHDRSPHLHAHESQAHH